VSLDIPTDAEIHRAVSAIRDTACLYGQVRGIAPPIMCSVLISAALEVLSSMAKENPEAARKYCTEVEILIAEGLNVIFPERARSAH